MTWKEFKERVDEKIAASNIPEHLEIGFIEINSFDIDDSQTFRLIRKRDILYIIGDSALCKNFPDEQES